MPRQAVELLCELEDGGELRRGQPGAAQLGELAERGGDVLARMCGKALAIAPISSGGRDIAAATSLMALRARYVSIMQTQAVRSAPYASKMIRYASSRRADSTSRSMSGSVARPGTGTAP